MVLKQMGPFDSDANVVPQSEEGVNTSRKSDEFLCHLPPKIPKYVSVT